MLRELAIYSFILLTLAACSKGTSTQAFLNNEAADTDNEFSARVIYGEDNRKDQYEITNPTLFNYSRSTALLTNTSQLSLNGDIYHSITQTFQEDMGLCDTERFKHQYSTGFCSGFLIGDNKVATAGHCIRDQRKCDSTAFVFDFATYNEQDPGPLDFPTENVFFCKKLITSYIKANGADYAIVELDRKVTDRTPLELRSEGLANIGEDLVVIGYPSGIPVKIADGGQVRAQGHGYFEANLDTYAGNSGSAVFNAKTGLVEGILVRGERDFTYQNGCRVSNVCEDDGCRGEDVTQITELQPYL